MKNFRARFCVGQLVRHRLFDYRGVIVDVDPEFAGNEEWYEMMALTRPPRDKPWYHVLVHDSVHSTYVAESNIEPDLRGDPILHPELEHYFSGYQNGLYVAKKTNN